MNQWLAAAPHAEVAHGALRCMVSLTDGMRVRHLDTALGPHTNSTLHRLADLEPRTLAVMHGSSFTGDGGAALRALAESYRGRLLASVGG
jgi:hypothetical protein